MGFFCFLDFSDKTFFLEHIKVFPCFVLENVFVQTKLVSASNIVLSWNNSKRILLSTSKWVAISNQGQFSHSQARGKYVNLRIPFSPLSMSTLDFNNFNFCHLKKLLHCLTIISLFLIYHARTSNIISHISLILPFQFLGIFLFFFPYIIKKVNWDFHGCCTLNLKLIHKNWSKRWDRNKERGRRWFSLHGSPKAWTISWIKE